MNFRLRFLPWPRVRRIALFLSILILAAARVAICQSEQPSPDAPSQMVQAPSAHTKPIPVGWKIGIVAIVAMGTGFVLAFSMRAWGSSNLFDRQYRFPTGAAAELRFGANKSGGCMATIEFGHRGGQGAAVFNRRP
jgi:hypothetical protein